MNKTKLNEIKQTANKMQAARSDFYFSSIYLLTYLLILFHFILFHFSSVLLLCTAHARSENENFQDWKRHRCGDYTGNVNAFLLDTDDVGAILYRRKLDVEQIVRRIANFAQFRYTTRGRDRCLHVQWTRTWDAPHNRATVYRWERKTSTHSDKSFIHSGHFSQIA